MPNRPGPAVDAEGRTVIDPTKNVEDLVRSEARSLRREAKIRAHYENKLRIAETARIDAIRAVDVGAVAAANQSAETRAVTLANQVATQAEAVRVGLAAALEPIQRNIADLQRFQFEAVGGKTQVTETQSRSGNLGLWVGLAIAGVFGLLSFLVAASSLIFALTR